MCGVLVCTLRVDPDDPVVGVGEAGQVNPGGGDAQVGQEGGHTGSPSVNVK